MATFLELVQELHLRVGAAAVAPLTVVSQRGEAARLVAWIREADYKIQTKWINWKFLRAVFSGATTASVATLAAPATLKTWDLATFMIKYPGETFYSPIKAIEYETVKSEATVTDEGVPGQVIVMPDNSLRFDVVPDAIYTIAADYYSKPIRLAANGDTSLIPEEYHLTAVLGRAIIMYANFENAPEIKTEGEELYEEGIAELENHQLPNQNYSRNRTGGGFEVIAE